MNNSSFELYGIKLYRNTHGTIMVDRHFYKNPEEQLYKLIPKIMNTLCGIKEFYSNGLRFEPCTEETWEDIHNEKIIFDGFTIRPDLLMHGYHPKCGSGATWYFEVKNGEMTNNDIIQAILAKDLLIRTGKPHQEQYNDGSDVLNTETTVYKKGMKYYGVIVGYITPERRKLLEHFGIFILLHSDYISIPEGADTWM